MKKLIMNLSLMLALFFFLIPNVGLGQGITHEFIPNPSETQIDCGGCECLTCPEYEFSYSYDPMDICDRFNLIAPETPVETTWWIETNSSWPYSDSISSGEVIPFRVRNWDAFQNDTLYVLDSLGSSVYSLAISELGIIPECYSEILLNTDFTNEDALICDAGYIADISIRNRSPLGASPILINELVVIVIAEGENISNNDQLQEILENIQLNNDNITSSQVIEYGLGSWELVFTFEQVVILEPEEEIVLMLTKNESTICAPQNASIDISVNSDNQTDYSFVEEPVGLHYRTYWEGDDDEHFQVTNCSGINVILNVLLEGAYDPITGEMSTSLNQRGLLPGQSPESPLVQPTPAGQPYNVAPWNYAGTEGIDWTDIDYIGIQTDWVLVSFRTGVEKNTEIARTAAVLLSNGSVGFPESCRLPQKDTYDRLFVVVEHRNHMGVMSPKLVLLENNMLTYDFSFKDSYRDLTSFGQKQLPDGTWAMFAGDADQSDFPSYDINGQDKVIWVNDNGQFDQYLPADLNLDGDVNGADKAIWFENNGISSRVPK